MSVPTDAELLEAVKNVLVSKPSLETDLKELSNVINQDKVFKWDLPIDRLAGVVKSIQDERDPEIVKPKELFNFDFSNATGASIKRGAHYWKDVVIDGIHHSQGGLGSFGVFLLKIKDKGVIVLKQQTPDTHNDFFAACFLRKMGIRAPDMRPLKKHELAEIEVQCRPAPTTVQGTCMEIHSQAMKEMGAVLFEFVPGKGLDSPEARRSLNPTEYTTILYHAGAIAAVDVILNNTDRTPFFHRGDGNSGNFMIATEPELQLVAIDQALTPIKSASGLSEYVSQFSSLENEFVKLSNFFKDLEICKKKFPDSEGLDQLKKGFASVLADLQKVRKALKESAQETKKAYRSFDPSESEKMFDAILEAYEKIK